MSKPVKDLMTAELASRYADLDNALWIELTGVDGLTTTELRRDLHSKKIRLEVVRNAIFRRAVTGKKLEPLARLLEGPAALLTGGESIIQVAKVAEEWQPKIKTLKLKAAVLDGELISGKAIEGLSKMPTKRDLQGKVVGAALSPGANLVAALKGPGAAIAGILKSLIEKLEKGGAKPAAAGEPAPAAS